MTARATNGEHGEGLIPSSATCTLNQFIRLSSVQSEILHFSSFIPNLPSVTAAFLFIYFRC